MVNRKLAAFTGFLRFLNRGLSYLDYAVHYVSGYLIYWLVGGLKPQWHTRPKRLENGEAYAPSVLITGASQGIGLATSLYLASKGYTVFASVKDEEELEHIKREIKHRDVKLDSGSIRPIIMNTLDKSSISAAVEEVANAVNDTHPLVGVVNNAGMCIVSPMELTPESCIRDLFELDLFAYIAVVHAFLPLIKKYRGRFINIGSYGGFVNPPMWVGYSAVKAAIEGMTRSWRFELKPFGVGMTCIRPGWTRTHGIGPKITAAWDAYFDNVDEGNVAGVDSLGNLVPTAKAVGPAERHIYGRMMMKWYRLIMASIDGVAETAENVAKTVHDAMMDPFVQPYYTVGYDALLGQMWRDLTPESLYEVTMYRMFEGRTLDKVFAGYAPER